MKTLLHIWLILILALPTYIRAEPSYRQLFIFGDSLSDTGNLASVTGPLPYPFYMNRISNGPVAVDVLAQRLGLSAEPSLHIIGPAQGTNYAVATADAFGNEIQDFPVQLLSFYTNHGYIAPTDALYVIFIGGNDVLHTRRVSDEEAAVIIQQAADSVRSAITSLSLSGARSFLLVNSPNAALVPAAITIASQLNSPEYLERLRKFSKLYRNKLHAIEDDLEHALGINIREFDLFTYFNKLIRKADDYGFINSTEGCFDRSTISFHPDCLYGLNFDKFVFFDELHPTARTHALIGEAMYQRLIEKDDDDEHEKYDD